MYKEIRLLAVLILALTALLVSGCSDGDSSSPAGLRVTTTTLANATVGTAYSQTLTASGATGATSWSLDAGALPAGLSLNATTGEISGTPTTAETMNFTVKVTDSATPTANTATRALSITVVAPGTLTVTTATLANATVGTSYNQTLAATGGIGSKSWSLAAGALPAGLSLDATTGVISGTPTTAGTVNFTVMVTDSATPTAGTATKALSITVVAAGAPLTVTTTSLANATVGTVYSQTLAATGGTGSTSWSLAAGALPAGLGLNATTGAITGTPTTAGTVNFTVMVTDSATPTANTASKALSIVVAAQPAQTCVTAACHAIPPATGRHVFHINNVGLTCQNCHGTGYSNTTVNPATHNNGVTNVVTSLNWNGTTCSPGCHGTRTW